MVIQIVIKESKNRQLIYHVIYMFNEKKRKAEKLQFENNIVLKPDKNLLLANCVRQSICAFIYVPVNRLN